MEGSDGLVLKGPLRLILLNDFPPDLKPKLQNPSPTKKIIEVKLWEEGVRVPRDLPLASSSQCFSLRTQMQSILKIAPNLPLSFFRLEKIEVPKAGTPQDRSSGAEMGRTQASLLTMPFPWWLT